jgi:glycosyltransferase involved in cell wall biosynthesis
VVAKIVEISMKETTENTQTRDNELRLPFISIITVVFNGAKTIEQTILSVLDQSYPNKEYLIIDGGSTDGTIDIIKKYSARLSYWVSESDSGVYEAMNKGIAKAKGELIGMINADDWYEPEVFNIIAEKYRETPDQVIHGLIRNFKDEEFYTMVGNSIRRLRYDMIQHPTCFIPRALYQRLGSYDSKYKYSADYDLILRYVNSGIKFCFVEKPFVNFRLGGISSLPQAEKEMYLVRVRHHLISKTEGFLRILLVSIFSFVKRFLK